MTVSLGPNRVARCEGCGGLWLDTASCRALLETDLDAAARSLATAEVGEPRRAFRGPFREPCANGASIRACPVCLRELASVYVHDADVTVGSCEHGVLVDARDVAAFLLASDIRRTLAEVNPPTIAGLLGRDPGGPLPGGLLLRLGAGVFLLSLALPSARVTVLWSKSNVVGFFGALFGPLVALEHPLLAVPVLANFLALLLLLKSRKLRATSAAMFASVFTVGALCTTVFGLDGQVEVLPGYWVWSVALLLLAFGTTLRATRTPATVPA